VHTIGWFVEDDVGRADGVGSRFFRIENAGTTAFSSKANIEAKK